MRKIMKDDERCIICNKKLKAQGTQSTKCSSCGNLYSKLKYKFPQKTDAELCLLVKEKLKAYKSNQKKYRRKPKYLKVKAIRQRLENCSFNISKT